ncbi:MAG: phenylacetate--CoA ligase [Planctomycetota bacterium]|jgi:phenylacetate-CoA ligase|nr:phenylacetate--CoA ligase [Planctomycetota bacterium]
MSRSLAYPEAYFDPGECLPRAELKRLQTARLRQAVARASALPFYRERLGGFDPNSIQEPGDVRRLPFTTKQDLRDGYPLGFLAIPRSEIARFHASSGTTGKMTFVPYSRGDMENWGTVVSRFLMAGGLRPGMLVQISFGYGLFTGGFGLHYGVEKVGAAVVPVASGNTERQLSILYDLQPDALVCTPSYALNIAEEIRKSGRDPKSLHLSLGFFGGEPWTEEMRERIEADLDVFATDNYGLSEVVGPGVAGECRERKGQHISEDNFLVECLNPESLEPVQPGERGELVITTLTKEAMPVIRYRTRDISSLLPDPCPCGRTGTLMTRVTGRTDDMLVIRGVNVYPTQIEEALLRVQEAAPHYHIEVTRPDNLDVASVKVEMRPEIFSDSMKDMEQLREKIARAISSITGIRMRVDLVAPETLERFVGKAKRVTDRRFKKD